MENGYCEKVIYIITRERSPGKTKSDILGNNYNEGYFYVFYTCKSFIFML